MELTPNLNLKKPAGTDIVNINDFNDNADVLDSVIANKVDKILGKQLSTEDYTSAEKTKLSGIAAGANNYSHPTTDGNKHVPANGTTNTNKVLKASATAGTYSWGSVAGSEVTEDSTHRFATDAEKTAWNGKANAVEATTSAAGLMSSSDKTKLNGIATGANNYTHPSGDGNLHVPATSTTNSGKVLKAGSTAGSLSWGTLAKADVGLGSVDNAQQATKTEFNTHLADYVRQPGYGATAGSANTYTLTLSPAPTAYVDGMGVVVKVNAANTGATTINVNGLGAKAIVDGKGSALTSGKLRLNGIYSLKYSTTSGNFQLVGEGGEYGTAGAAQVLSGYTVGTDNGLVAGTIPSKGAQTYTPGATAQTVAAGQYLSGAQTVAAVSFDASKVLTGTTIAGTAGTMANRSGEYPATNNIVYNPGTPNENRIFVQPPQGYYSGGSTGTWTGGNAAYITDTNYVAGNIKAGTSVFGLAGSFTSDATAIASNIEIGKSAYVNGTKITGTLPVNPGLIAGTSNHLEAAGHLVGAYSPDAVTRLYMRPGSVDETNPNGAKRIINSDVWITTPAPNHIPSNIRAGVTDLGVTGTYGTEKGKVEVITAAPLQSIRSKAVYWNDRVYYMPSRVPGNSTIKIYDANGTFVANIVCPWGNLIRGITIWKEQNILVIAWGQDSTMVGIAYYNISYGTWTNKREWGSVDSSGAALEVMHMTVADNVLFCVPSRYESGGGDGLRLYKLSISTGTIEGDWVVVNNTANQPTNRRYGSICFVKDGYVYWAYSAFELLRNRISDGAFTRIHTFDNNWQPYYGMPMFWDQGQYLYFGGFQYYGLSNLPIWRVDINTGERVEYLIRSPFPTIYCCLAENVNFAYLIRHTIHNSYNMPNDIESQMIYKWYI